MDVDELLAQPRRRRLWLLTEAIACVPLDRALDLAKAADEFVVGQDELVSGKTEAVQVRRASETDAPKNGECDDTCRPRSDHEEPKVGLMSLSPGRREELLNRIAHGETNAMLAEAFGLTRKQIQGFRMGAARRIASRCPVEHSHKAESEPDRVSASIEDVVRYLRQQDDVVVPEGSNRYVVNGRFHLDQAELLAKANRIRARHNKPLFELGQLATESLSGQIARPGAIPAYRLDPVSPETQH